MNACSFGFHKWGIWCWEERLATLINPILGTIGSAMVQAGTRTCSRCGMIQRKTK